MNNGLRHFANQFAAAWRSWLVILVFSFAAGVFFMSMLLSTEPDFLVGGMFVVLLAQVGWGVAVVGAGSVNSTATDKPAVGLRPGASLAGRPNPTIPIHRITRVGAEALAGLAVLMAFQAAFLVLALFLTGRDALPLVRVSLLGDVAALPAAAAWLLPARSKHVYGLRGAAVSLAGAVAVYTSVSMGSPVPALLVSMGLAVVLFATSDVVARVERRPCQVERSARLVLTRRSRPPLRQLWRDALLGPIENGRRMLLLAACFACAAFVALLLEFVLVGDTLIMAATFGAVATLAMSPLGLTIVDDPPRRAVRTVLTGGSWAGGSMLPLRQEWVARCFYAHGLVTGLLMVGLGLFSAEFPGMPLFFGVGTPGKYAAGWLPWLLMVPSFAGMLASSTAGDRRLRALSLSALILTPPGYLAGIALTSQRFHILDVSGDSRIWFAGAVGMVFAMVGGVPPLVYLFPRKRASVRGVRQP